MFQAIPHSLATHHHVWWGPLDDGPGLSPVSAESDFSNVSPGYFPSRSGPRGRQAESSRSLACPLLLRSDVAVDAGGSAREPVPERGASPASSGGDERDVEGEDGPTYCLSAHTRRSLAVQEAWKKVQDRKRKREEDEGAELDEGAGPGDGRSKDDHREDRGGGAGEDGPSGGAGLTV